MPDAEPGQEITCPKCGGKHVLEASEGGKALILFYRCDGKIFMGGFNGKLTIGYPSDVHGEI